jgi:hypothetical protein
MLETHIMMSLLTFHPAFLLVLCLVFLMDLTIAHLVLVHESGLVVGRFDVNPHFHHGSHPTRSNGEVQMIVKTSSGLMVKCWIPKFFSPTPALSH